MIRSLISRAQRRLSDLFFEKQIRKFTNRDVTLLCNNCIGGIILHDLKLPFNTPTINLFFHAPDYIAFLERLEYYLGKEIIFSNQSKYDSVIYDYPIGKIEDIEVHFVHYPSVQEAKFKWETRVKRVNLKNLFVIGSDRGYCTPQIVERFLKLPYKNKLFFSSKRIPSKQVVYFKEYADQEEVADMINHDNAWYYQFHVPHWLNTGIRQDFYLIAKLFHVYRMIRRKYQVLNRSQEKYERSIRLRDHQFATTKEREAVNVE